MQVYKFHITLFLIIIAGSCWSQSNPDSTTSRLTLCTGRIFVPGQAVSVDTLAFKEGIAYSIQLENKPSYIFVKCGGTLDMKCDDSLSVLLGAFSGRDTFDLKMSPGGKHLAARYIKMGFTTVMYCNVAPADIAYYDHLLNEIVGQLKRHNE